METICKIVKEFFIICENRNVDASIVLNEIAKKNICTHVKNSKRCTKKALRNGKCGYHSEQCRDFRGDGYRCERSTKENMKFCSIHGVRRKCIEVTKRNKRCNNNAVEGSTACKLHDKNTEKNKKDEKDKKDEKNKKDKNTEKNKKDKNTEKTTYKEKKTLEIKKTPKIRKLKDGKIYVCRESNIKIIDLKNMRDQDSLYAKGTIICESPFGTHIKKSWDLEDFDTSRLRDYYDVYDIETLRLLETGRKLMNYIEYV
jgi:hypothetical protein